jgi:hypothetical protein
MATMKYHKNYDPSSVRAYLDYYDHLTFRFKWSTSHDPDTEGYPICTLYVADNDKLGKYHPIAWCDGGGYDMLATCLGNMITEILKPELTVLSQAAQLDDRGFSCGREYDCDGLYTLENKSVFHNRKVYINGAWGWNAVVNIVNKLGYQIKWTEYGKTFEMVGE